MITDSVLIHWLGLQDYEQCWHAMRDFTNQRDENTQDEIWVVEHPPVFTQGQNGKPEHILDAGNIPIIQVDRGGQVTYHGPGQLVIYPLVDLKRKKLNVRETVTILEQSVIQLLKEYNMNATSHCKAPGVYIDDKKICSLGLRIRRGCSFHGIALNLDMDLTPFSRINPCGYSDLKMTQLSDFIRPVNIKQVGQKLIDHLTRNLGYTVSSRGARALP